jgi:hypothetical protein
MSIIGLILLPVKVVFAAASSILRLAIGFFFLLLNPWILVILMGTFIWLSLR